MRYDDDPELEVDGDDEDESSYEDDNPEPEPGIEEEDPNEVPDLVDPDEDANEVLPGDAEALRATAAAEIPSDEEAEGESAAQSEIASFAPRHARLGDLLVDYKFWQNPRTLTGLDDASIQAVADDILKKTQVIGKTTMAGVDDPLLVVRINANGGVHELVLDGQRRHRAMHLAKMGDDVLVPVRDVEPEPVDWSQDQARRYLKKVLTKVGLRAGLSAFELSEAAERLRGNRDPDSGREITIAEIADTVGRSDSWVSKILTARKNASPKLLSRWRRGEISEEQFRDLASGVKDPEKQAAAAGEIAEQRKSGDKAAARRATLEAKEQAQARAKAEREAAKAAKAAAKAEKRAKKTAKGSKSKGAAVRGPQADLPMDPKAATPPPSAPKPKAMSPAIVDDLLDQASRKPPTHEYVKGVLAGIQIATGRLGFENLPKPWHSYIHHLAGTKPEPSRKRRR
jgi:ParB-like chromosome segregation protein Spo0J